MSTWPKGAWKAVRRGAIYCAPACGGGCTWADYQGAHKDAKKLAARLGKGWTVDVWENLGWHWRVFSPCKRITVSESGARWLAMLGEAGSGTGSYSAQANTPELSIIKVIRYAKADLAKMGAFLKGL